MLACFFVLFYFYLLLMLLVLLLLPPLLIGCTVPGELGWGGETWDGVGGAEVGERKCLCSAGHQKEREERAVTFPNHEPGSYPLHPAFLKFTLTLPDVFCESMASSKVLEVLPFVRTRPGCGFGLPEGQELGRA